MSQRSCGRQRASKATFTGCRFVELGILHLSRDAKQKSHPKVAFVFGAPGEIRTPYPLVRSQVLYPDELRALKDANYSRDRKTLKQERFRALESGPAAPYLTAKTLNYLRAGRFGLAARRISLPMSLTCSTSATRSASCAACAAPITGVASVSNFVRSSASDIEFWIEPFG